MVNKFLSSPLNQVLFTYDSSSEGVNIPRHNIHELKDGKTDMFQLLTERTDLAAYNEHEGLVVSKCSEWNGAHILILLSLCRQFDWPICLRR